MRVRVAAAVAAALLVAGCGTRLDRSQIEAAAGIRPAQGGTDSAATTGADPGMASAPAEPLPGEALATGAPDGTTAPSAGPTSAVTSGARPPGAAVTAPTRTGAAVGTVTPGTGAATGTRPSQPRAAQGAAAAPAPAAAQPAPAPAKPPIVLGHVGDYSGVIGTVIKGGPTMAGVVARYINDHGGLDGHPVQVITGDAGGDPGRALSLVRDMVENKGAVAFVGTMMIVSGYGPRSYLEQRKIPVIGGDTLTNLWLESPVFFASSAPFANVTVGALKIIVEQGHKKLALLHCVEAEVCKTWHDTIDAKAKDFGAQIVYQQQVSLTQPDFTAECAQAQRSGATAVMLGFDGPSIGRFARACVQQGYRPAKMTAALAVTDGTAQDPNLDGLMSPQGNFPHMATDLPAEQEYHNAIARYAPTLRTTPAMAMIWTAGALLRESQKTLPAGKTGPADFFPGLWAIKSNTLGGLVGPLSFDQNGLAGDNRCFFLARVERGAWVAPDGSRQHCY